MALLNIFKTQAERANKKKQLQEKHVPIIIDDDEDFQPKKQITVKRKNKSRIQYDSDSDEDPIGKKHKPGPSSTKGAGGSHGKSSSPKKRTVTSLSDYFGSAPVRRSEVAVKRSHKGDGGGHKDTSNETNIIPDSPPHSDATKAQKTSTAAEKKPSPVKRQVSPSKSETPPAKKLKSLADKSKLSKATTAPETSEGTEVVKKTTTKPPTASAKQSESTSSSIPSSIQTPTKPPTLQKASSSSASRGQQYRAYLNRAGPSAPGSKTIPKGAPGCMTGLTIVITGVLESLERDEAKELIEKYGGKVTQSISKKTSYVLIGSEPGQSKLAKAATFNVKQITEDELLDLIGTLPAKTNTPKSSVKGKGSKTTPASKAQQVGVKKAPVTFVDLETKPSKEEALPVSKDMPSDSQRPPEQLMWVDKYRPEATKHVIGQQGDKSCVKKLLNWLQNWEKNYQKGVKKGTANSGAQYGRDDGSTFKVALLSGPPGIGKTTTATLACKESGYSFVEMNASSTRSKKGMQEQVADQLGTCSILAYDKGRTGGSDLTDGGKRHVLIMDEVDGMAGNEDRGGIPELIKLIKTSRIPIICICNDRQHTKIRSLANYCYDLRFQRPKVDQIKGAMMRIVFQEQIKITGSALEELIVASGQDLRQVLHNLSLWSAGSKAVSSEQGGNRIKKELKLGPFDAVKEVFAAHPPDGSNTIAAKSDLFFTDYSIMPLFVQENYLSIRPTNVKGNMAVMDQISKAADAICDGNLVEKHVRSRNDWGLLPSQAVFSTVLPGELLQGHMSAKIAFPQWLGNFSKGNKHQRLLQELHSHSGLKTSCNRSELGMEYLQHFHYHTTKPLLDDAENGAKEAVSFLEQYDFTKEDWDNIMELCKMPGKPDPLALIPPKVKASFTRAYKAAHIVTPYSLDTTAAKKTTASRLLSESDEMYGEEATEEDEEESSKSTDISRDAMIKVSQGKGKSGQSGSSKQRKKTADTQTKKHKTTAKRKQ